MYSKKVCQTTINLADPSMENPNQIQTQYHTHQHRETQQHHHEKQVLIQQYKP